MNHPFLIPILRSGLLAVVLAVSGAVSCRAQAGLDSLATSYVFGKAPISRILETHIEGNQLADRGMRVFRCVEFRLQEPALSQIEARLEQDIRRCSSKEVTRRQGVVTFAMLQFHKPGHKHRSYLIYCRQTAKGKGVCVYIEGTVTAEQIKDMFYTKP